MIIQSYKIGNTQINIADNSKITDESKRKLQIESFNEAGCKIIQSLLSKEKR